MGFLEKYLIKKRGWISRWPTKAVFIYSGGLDSTITMARLMGDKKVEIYPLFINRGQTNLKFERKSAFFFEKYFLRRYKKFFHPMTEIKINIPPKELKEQLKFYTTKFGHPLRNTILQMLGTQYATSLSTDSKKRITTVFCAQVSDDPFPHSKLKSLRATTVDVCQGLGEWDWQITSPNIDPILTGEQWDKMKMVRWAIKHGLPIKKTRSCYSDKNEHCGVCLSCRRRKEAFKKAKVDDETKYINSND